MPFITSLFRTSVSRSFVYSSQSMITGYFFLEKTLLRQGFL